MCRYLLTFAGMRAGQGRVLHVLTLRSPMPQKELAYVLGVRHSRSASCSASWSPPDWSNDDEMTVTAGQ